MYMMMEKSHAFEPISETDSVAKHLIVHLGKQLPDGKPAMPPQALTSVVSGTQKLAVAS